ncbi:MAG TPA: hypothetical protein VKD72_34035 [Gemmataceae bacterium]|nr:hypothetical protein [Gemmataceae bacterium]
MPMTSRRRWIGCVCRGLVTATMLACIGCDDWDQEPDPQMEALRQQARQFEFQNLLDRQATLGKQIREQLSRSGGQVTSSIADLQNEYRALDKQIDDFAW